MRRAWRRRRKRPSLAHSSCCTVYSHALYSYGLCCGTVYSHGLYSYGLCCSTVYSHGLYSYGLCCGTVCTLRMTYANMSAHVPVCMPARMSIRTPERCGHAAAVIDDGMADAGRLERGV